MLSGDCQVTDPHVLSCHRTTGAEVTPFRKDREGVEVTPLRKDTPPEDTSPPSGEGRDILVPTGRLARPHAELGARSVIDSA